MKLVHSLLSAKTLVIAGTVAALFGAAATAYAWGPSRQTFTVANPAPYVTFDSITDNPNYGDERTFFDAKNSTNTNSGGYADQNTVTDGETVLLRMYVHNNAASNLNGTDNTGSGVAHNTSVRVFLPTATATALQANAYIDASNANPTEVNDTTEFNASQAFNLSYVPGSATAYNNAHPTGMPLNDSIVTTGAPIGYNQADGNVPGCFQYVNIVTIKVKVSMPKPSFSITKQVGLPGSGVWAKSVTAKPGDTVSYLLTVKNTGNTTLNDLSVRDKLPANEHIVPGSTVITNTNHPSGISAGSDAVVSNGIDIGAYQAGSVAYVSYKVTIDPVSQLPCGTTDLKNTATVFQPGNNTTQSDTADVNVTGNTCTTTTTTTPPTTTPPTTLVNTGAGDVFGIFGLTTIVGAVAHRLFTRRFARG